MPKPTITAIAVATLLLVSGCASLSVLEPSADPTEFHVIDSGVAGETFTELDPGGPSILIGKARLAKHLDHRQIVVYPGPNRIDFAGVHRWAEPLDEGVDRLLMAQLGNGLNTSRITFLQVARALEWDYRVGYHIDRLGGVPGGTVEVQVNWWVRDGEGTIIRHEHSFFEVEAEGGSDDVDAYVASIQAVLELWAGRVVEVIKEF